MQDEKKKIDALVLEYDEAYRDMIREHMEATETEFETFILSLIM